MTETLKPCPFCGGADIDTHFSLDGAGNVTTGCLTCGASGPETSTPDEAKGAEAWNRRALRPEGVWVPEEPTKEMQWAGGTVTIKGGFTVNGAPVCGTDNAAAVYKAMLAARPGREE
jgi:Lar family restriction alleviation protein